MSQQGSPGWNGLEAARPPAAVQEQPGQRRLANNGRGIGHDVDDAGPLPHHLELAKDREHVEHAGYDTFENRQVAPLSIGRNAVQRTADDQFSLVRLADINARVRRDHHRIENRLYRFGNAGLQGIGVDRQPEPCLGGEYRGMPGHSHAGSLRPYRAARRHDAATTSALDDEIGDLAVLYDIHANAASSARITPGHGI